MCVYSGLEAGGSMGGAGVGRIIGSGLGWLVGLDSGVGSSVISFQACIT